MQTLTQLQQLRAILTDFRSKGQRVAFVPTMGNLHDGHLQLIHAAQQRSDKIVVSIFVNPFQFSPIEDFVNYPRTLHQDQEKLAALNINVLFTPADQVIYPNALESHTFVDVPIVSLDLCGVIRPQLFRGVCTVIAKLFNLVQPHVAVFGEKDFQQLHIIRRMVVDLCMPIEIVGVSTVREADGLAMSSRNHYLTEEQRKLAPLLYKILQQSRQDLLGGDRNFDNICQLAIEKLTHNGFNVDYFTVRRREDLQLGTEKDKQLIILVAAYLGKTRLIDNVSVDI